MPRKGMLEEIFSRALHSSDDPLLYSVGYRDFEQISEVSLPEFITLSENFQVIPASRIMYVKKAGEVLYRSQRVSSH